MTGAYTTVICDLVVCLSYGLPCAGGNLVLGDLSIYLWVIKFFFAAPTPSSQSGPVPDTSTAMDPATARILLSQLTQTSPAAASPPAPSPIFDARSWLPFSSLDPRTFPAVRHSLHPHPLRKRHRRLPQLRLQLKQRKWQYEQMDHHEQWLGQ